jgi:hypothetical protein
MSVKSTINNFMFQTHSKMVHLKTTNINLKSNLEGIYNFSFQNLLINIGWYNSRSKHMDMNYKS